VGLNFGIEGNGSGNGSVGVGVCVWVGVETRKIDPSTT
jgi:hypothetical protein